LKGKNISIKGSITINGVTKPITLSGIYKGEFINPMTKTTIAVFQITTDIVRKDFNIGLSYPTAALGDVVKLESTVELISVCKETSLFCFTACIIYCGAF